MFHPSLDEKKKLEIAELYQFTGIPMEKIAEKVGVSLRTVYNYKNYRCDYDYYCTECGYEFNGNLKKCPKCGDKFD